MNTCSVCGTEFDEEPSIQVKRLLMRGPDDEVPVLDLTACGNNDCFEEVFSAAELVVERMGL